MKPKRRNLMDVVEEDSKMKTWLGLYERDKQVRQRQIDHIRILYSKRGPGIVADLFGCFPYKVKLRPIVISKATGLPWSTTDAAIKYLVRNGYLKSVEEKAEERDELVIKYMLTKKGEHAIIGG
jgi:DNA-binding MarR family transcriptional regulator